MSDGKVGQANKYLAELKQAYKNRQDILALEGWMAIEQQRFGDAIRVYTKVMELNPGSGVVRMLASAQWQIGEKDNSILTLKDWIEKHPEDTTTLVALADAYSRHAQADKAITIYTKIIEKSPKAVIALNNLALILSDNNLGKAIEYAEQAVKMMPENAALQDTLGTLLVKNGQLDEGISYLSKAARIAPGSMEIQFNLAQAYIENKNNEQARVLLEKILQESQRFSVKEEARKLLRGL